MATVFRYRVGLLLLIMGMGTAGARLAVSQSVPVQSGENVRSRQREKAGLSARITEQENSSDRNKESRSAEPAAGGPRQPAAGSIPDDYLIGAGDTLQISVWKEPEVGVPSVVVRPDGKITGPLIKEV